MYMSLLLGLALLFTCFTAGGTIRAYQHFQQDHQRLQAGDVTTISSWMTIPYIVRVYKVPEMCFTQSLRLTDRWLVEHATLRVIADRDHRPLMKLVFDVQNIILSYRRQQLTCGPPPSNTMQALGVHTLLFSSEKGEAV